MSFLDKLKQKLEKYSDDNTLTNKDPLIADDVWVSTGCPELDYNLRTFGFKKGIIEIAGASTAGKTTMGLTVVRNFLNKYPDAVCIFMLSEERINGDYVKRIGVDFDRVIKVTSNFLEDLFYKTQRRIDEIADAWSEAKLPGLPKIILLWDSINATNSRAELETYKENVKKFNESDIKGTAFKMKHAKMADFAKAGKALVKAMLSQLYEKDIIMVCLNHLTADIANPMGGKTSTGGSWREFFCYLRLEMTLDKLATGKLKIDGEKWAQITNVKVIKNDFAGYGTTQIKLAVGYGLMLNDEDIEYAVEQKILKEEKGKYSFMGDKLKWSSPRTLLNLYRSENKLLLVLHNKIATARHADVLKFKDDPAAEEHKPKKKPTVSHDDDEEEE